MVQHNLLSGNKSVVMFICSIHRAGQRCHVHDEMSIFGGGGGRGESVHYRYVVPLI
jgi:hypothetical protein